LGTTIGLIAHIFHNEFRVNVYTFLRGLNIVCRFC
jgi:hypothetical protein